MYQDQHSKPERWTNVTFKDEIRLLCSMVIQCFDPTRTKKDVCIQ